MTEEIKEIRLPAGTTHVRAGDIPRLMAEAMYPNDALKRAQFQAFMEVQVREDIANGVLKISPDR